MNCNLELFGGHYLRSESLQPADFEGVPTQNHSHRVSWFRNITKPTTKQKPLPFTTKKQLRQNKALQGWLPRGSPFTIPPTNPTILDGSFKHTARASGLPDSLTNGASAQSPQRPPEVSRDLVLPSDFWVFKRGFEMHIWVLVKIWDQLSTAPPSHSSWIMQHVQKGSSCLNQWTPSRQKILALPARSSTRYLASKGVQRVTWLWVKTVLGSHFGW